MTIESLKGPKGEKQYTSLTFFKRGGMGEIYMAHDSVSNRQVAIKMIAIDDNSEIKLLENESKISLLLTHDNIIKTYYAGVVALVGVEFYYHVMEFHVRGNLKTFIAGFTESIPLQICFKIMMDLSKGLYYAHQKIVHRDLKPENVLVGNDDNYKICDFGLAKYVDNKTRTHTFKGSGTYPYMAPECWTFDTNTVSMDIYSLGIVFFEILTKKLPFSGLNENEIKEKHLFEQLPNILDFRGDIPMRLAEMIVKMTSKRPADRYGSAQEILNILDSLTNEIIEKPSNSDKLVQLAHKKMSDQKREELEGQKRMSELQTKEKLLDHSTDMLFKKFTDRVDDLNRHLEQAKIQTQKGRQELILSFQGKSIQFSFFPEGDISNQIDRWLKAGKDFQIRQYGFLIQEVGKSYLEKDKVILIGKAEIGGSLARTSWGYNLILRKTDADDLYGEWAIAWFNDSPLFAGRQLEHYPLDIPEFYQEFEYGRGNVNHVRNMAYKLLTNDDIESSLEQILS